MNKEINIKTIDIGKYHEALNNLLGVDSEYYRGDKDVDAIVEIIITAKKFEEIIKEQQTGISKLKKSNRNWRRKSQRLRNRIEDLEYRLSGLLCDVTGNRMSKAYYPLSTMIAQAHDYQQECCEDCEYYKGENQ